MISEDNDFGSVHTDDDEQQTRTKAENNQYPINETSNSLPEKVTSHGMYDSESLYSYASKLGEVDDGRGRSNTLYEDAIQVSQEIDIGGGRSNNVYENDIQVSQEIDVGRGRSDTLYKDADRLSQTSRNDSVVSANEFSGRSGSLVSANDVGSNGSNGSIASAIDDSGPFDRNSNSNFQSVRIDDFDRKDNNNFKSAREWGVENPAFRNNAQDTTIGNHVGHSPRPAQSSECGIMPANPRICKFFTYTGMYHLRWNNDHYEVREALFILAYLLWFIWPMIGFVIAYVGHRFWNYDKDKDMNDIWQASLVVLGFALIPAIQTYTIRIFNENLPSILKDISLIDTEQKFQNIKSGSHVNILKMSFGLLPKSCQFNIHSFYKKVPEITFLLAGITSLVTLIVGIVYNTESNYVFQEWPFLVMILFYQVLPVFSTWFCLIFIDWQKVCYKKIYKDMKRDEATVSVGMRQTQDILVLAPILNTKNIQILAQYFDRVQDIFSDLSEKVFAYVLGVNVLVFLANSIFCASRMMKNFEYVFYIIPLFVSIYHLFLMCDRCSNLRKKHSMILAELKHVLQSLEKMDNANASEREQIYSIHRFRENLHDSPPQVTVFGSFSMDFRMLTTLFGFIISYALIINELFDDSITCTYIPPEYNVSQMVVR